MPIRAVLFDWGGTLVRTLPAPPPSAYAAVAHYARHHLYLALREEVLELACNEAAGHGGAANSLRIDGLLNTAFERLGWSIDPADISTCAGLFFNEATAADSVFDDARALLASLKYRGFRTAVVANSMFPGKMYAGLLAEIGLTGYLDAFVTSADVGRSKPAPDAYLHALAALDVDPHEALFVDDTVETGVAGARAAGLRAVLIDRAGHNREAAGYLVIERLAALGQLLGEGTVA
jgi:HAD superfamily hydrolase (TIGR01509 family)